MYGLFLMMHEHDVFSILSNCSQSTDIQLKFPDIHELLGGIDLAIFQEHTKPEFTQNSIQFNSDSFRFGSADGQSSFYQSNDNVNSHGSNFFKNPSSLKSMLHYHKTRRGSFSRLKLSSFTNFPDNDIIMVKHQRRVNALGDMCPPTCNLEDNGVSNIVIIFLYQMLLFFSQ